MNQNNLLDRLQCYQDTIGVLMLKLDYLQDAKAQCCGDSSSSSSSSTSSSSSSSSTSSSSSSSSTFNLTCCEDVEQLSISFTYTEGGDTPASRGYIGVSPVTFIKIGSIPSYMDDSYCIYEAQGVTLNEEFDRLYFVIPHQDFPSDAIVFLYHIDGGAPGDYAAQTLANTGVCEAIGFTHTNENTTDDDRIDTFTILESSGSWSSSSSDNLCPCPAGYFDVTFPVNDVLDETVVNFTVNGSPPSPLVSDFEPELYCLLEATAPVDWVGPDYGDLWMALPRFSGSSIEIFGYDGASSTYIFSSEAIADSCPDLIGIWDDPSNIYNIDSVEIESGSAPSSSSSSSSDSSSSSSSSESSSSSSSSGASEIEGFAYPGQVLTSPSSGQWNLNGSPISGETGSTLEVPFGIEIGDIISQGVLDITVEMDFTATRWTNYWAAKLATLNAADLTSASRSNMGATLSGSDKYYGNTLGADGKIYCIPYDATTVLIIDPVAGTASTTNFGLTLTDGDKWSGGVLAPNGKIYCAPVDSTTILIIDTLNGTASRTNMGASLGGTDKWMGGVLGPDGKIYFIPYSSASILIVDPEANTVTLSNMGATLTGSAKWWGGVLGPDGKIYGVPFANTAGILIIDPLAGTASISDMGASMTGATKWIGGVLAPNGKIYCAPLNATDILIINPLAGTATRNNLGITFGGSLDCLGGTLGADGRVYFIPRDRTTIPIIDPVTEIGSVSSLGATLTDTKKWHGGTLAPNGIIYTAPLDANDILQIGTGVSVDQVIPQSAYLNVT